MNQRKHLKQCLMLACALHFACATASAVAEESASEKLVRLEKTLLQQQAEMEAMRQTIQAIKLETEQRIQLNPAADAIANSQPQQWETQAMSDELKALQQRPTVIAGEKDGLSFKSGNSNFSIRLHGLVQADYRDVDADPLNTATANATFFDGWMVRKARPWIEGTLFGWIDYRLTPEFATSTNNVATVSNGTTTVNGSVTLGTPEVIDAYFDAKFRPWLKLRVGKFKPFVGLARLQSDVDGKFLEQSFVTANLLPQRDVGVALHGDVWEGKLNYALGFSNGVVDGGDQSVTLDNNNDKELTARIFVQPFKGDGTAWAGLGVGIAATTIDQIGKNTNAAASQLPFYRDFGQINFFSYVTTSNQAAFADGRRERWAPQGYYYYGPFGLMAEYALEDQEVTRSTNHRTLQHEAWQTTFSYLLTGEDASYGGVRPKQAFEPNSSGWGAWELVARFSQMRIDPDTFLGTTATRMSNIATSAKQATAWGLGINWYLNNYTRISLNYEETSFEGGAAGSTANNTSITKLVDKQDERAMIGRMQVAF